MPELEFTSIELNEATTSPIDEILSQLSAAETQGPIMILGLERSCPSEAPFHPILERLNLSRPRWPRELPQPVVFWIPEYLLGLLGREAPDFLDWRSDTLYFPELAEVDLGAIDFDLWKGGADSSLSEPRRRARIAELRSRLVSAIEAKDRYALAARASWMSELGNHFFFLGQFEEAEQVYREALALEENLGRWVNIAVIETNLSHIYQVRGDLDHAEEEIRRAIEIDEKLKDRSHLSSNLESLAILQLKRGDAAGAERQLHEALAIREALDEPLGVASVLHNLASIFLGKGDVSQAESLLRRAEQLYRRHNERLGLAHVMANLGLVARVRGDLGRAEEMYQEALTLNQLLGSAPGVARNYLGLGQIRAEEGDLDRARELWTEAHLLFKLMGMTAETAEVEARLQRLLEDSKPLERLV